ncbi:hypothetical protein ACQ4PT_004010 [Festuca glaucescens]
MFLLMFHDMLICQGTTIMPATPEYERNRLARIQRRKAKDAEPLANIRDIASQLLYGQNEKDKQRRKGDDGANGSEYEPNDDEEEDDADEVSGEDEEQEPTLHMSKEKTDMERKGVKHLSTEHSSSSTFLSSMGYQSRFWVVYDISF